MLPAIIYIGSIKDQLKYTLVQYSIAVEAWTKACRECPADHNRNSNYAHGPALECRNKCNVHMACLEDAQDCSWAQEAPRLSLYCFLDLVTDITYIPL